MALNVKALRAEDWALSGGTGKGWRAVTGLRRDRAAAALKAAKAALKGAGKDLRACAASADALLALKGPEGDRALTEPALDYWLHLRATHFDRERPLEEWRLHYGLLGGMAAGAAWAGRRKGSFPGAFDPGGRLNLHGGPFVLAAAPEDGLSPVSLSVSPSALEARAGARSARWTRAEAEALAPGASLERGGLRLERLVEAAPGMVVDGSCWLVNRGVEMHGLASLDAAERVAFAAVIARALGRMRSMAPGLHAEMTDLTRLLVPLKTNESMSSVSSSYVNMRGAICLSPSDSELLQAETLIHEFCHQKMNQLLEVDPLILPGQSGQAFYSPWRADARRLRGLLLGAHAFLNVGSLLLGAASEGGLRRKELVDVMLNVAIRALQTEDALRSVSMYADMTPFGLEFCGVMRRELARVHSGALAFPPELLAEAKAKADAHRAAHALGNTGLHRADGWTDRVGRAPFLTPGAAGIGGGA